jgi:LCP family protein required for cell wall assembly
MFDPLRNETPVGQAPGPVETQPHRFPPTPTSRRPSKLAAVLFGLLLGLTGSIYLLYPDRTNILLLGSDLRPNESGPARSDTMILTTVLPLEPYVGALSIPRDLWVDIPGFGPNRINAASFLAEAAQPGSGSRAAVETVRANFGVDVDAYVSLDFVGLVRFIDGLGGVDIDLDQATGGYEAGRHHLNGTQALAFARDRKGSDDFFRMARGQILLRATLRRMMNPLVWPRWPLAFAGLLGTFHTDLPPWEWPRVAFSLARVGPAGVDGRVIGRDMARGFTTNGGAQVLAPDWARINPVLLEMFGQ